jgi:fatty-acyl-CoA synthase
MTASYASGTSLSPLLGETIGANLARTVNRVPDAEALVSCHQGLRYRYAELDEMIDLVARGLLDSGLTAGDRLGIWSPNRAEWVFVSTPRPRSA